MFGSSYMIDYVKKLEHFFIVFPPAVPNDPLVPTAVLGEISDLDVYVTFAINKYPALITHHCHRVLSL